MTPPTHGRFGLAVAAGLLLAAAAQAQPERYTVLTVGVNKYKNPKVRSLSGAANDAKDSAALFGRQGKGTRAVVLTDEQATRAAVLGELNNLPDKVRPGDLVFLLFSGHGDRARGEFVFLPHDADPASDPTLTRSSIPGAALVDAVRPLVDRGHHVVLVIDACHAGQFYHTADAAGLFDLKPGRTGGLTLFCSSVASQTSADAADNGIFTRALVEALSGKADADGDGKVTVREARWYLNRRLRTFTGTRSRMPGLPAREQDGVCESSLTIPEGTPLTRATVGRDAAGPAAPGAAAARGTWDPTSPAVAPLLGTWKWETRTPRAGGPDVRVEYTVEFRADGTFTASLRRQSAEVERHTGTYRELVGGSGVSLDLGAMQDLLKFDSPSKDELRVRPLAAGGRELTLTRVGK